MDDAVWRTVYHSKETEEKRGTITKTSETIARGDKTFSSSPDAHKPIKTIYSDTWSEKGKEINSTATFPTLGADFFEKIISDCENKFHGTDKAGTERIIKIEMNDSSADKVKPKRVVEETKKSGEDQNIRRYVYTLNIPNIGHESQKVGEDKTEERMTKKEHHVQEIQTKKKIELNGTEQEVKKNISSTLNDSGKRLDTPSKIPIYARNTYKDWKQAREKLLKEFENIQSNRMKGCETRNVLSNGNSSKGDIIDASTWPKTRCQFRKKIHAMTDDWEMQFSTSAQCQRYEEKMVGNLKEIHEIVDDVRKLSHKFPKMFENGGKHEIRGEPKFIQPEITLKTCFKETEIDSWASPKEVVYVTEVVFPVNGTSYKSNRPTAI